MQKIIILSGHISDALLTVISPSTMGKMCAAEQKILADVTQEAAVNATNEIRKREGELVECTGEVVKAGRSMVFVRGLITCKGEPVASFSSVLKKTPRRG